MTSPLKVTYSLSSPEDFGSLSEDVEVFAAKINSNKGLQKSMRLYKTQLSYMRSYLNKKDDLTVEAYKDMLVSLAFSLLQVNVQAKTSQLKELTGYGIALNDIRKQVYPEQNTKAGFAGTLMTSQIEDNQNLSGLDTLERTLVNFYETTLQLDPYLSPRKRFQLVLESIDLPLEKDFYIELELKVLEAVQNNDVRQQMETLLLDVSDLKDLRRRLWLCDFDKESSELLNYMFDNNHIDFDFYNHKVKSINYNLIGGVPLVLVAFVVEGIITVARILSSLPPSDRVKPFDLYLGEVLNAEEKHQLAEHLALSYDAAEILEFSMPEFKAIRGAIYNDIQKFMTRNITTQGEYRLDV